MEARFAPASAALALHSANHVHLGGLQPDANGSDLWLAVEHPIGRNPPAADRQADGIPKRDQKTAENTGSRPGNGLAGSSWSSSVVGSQRHQRKFHRKGEL